MSFRHALIALLAVALFAPASAQASTVSITDGTLTVTAAPGELNRLTVKNTGEVLDSNAPLVAGTGCAAGGAGRLVCTAPTRVTADLGDGDDTLTITGAMPSTIGDGAGRDTVTGGTGGNVVPRIGRVLGRTGADTLAAGGTGTALGGGAGNDRLIGKAANDTLSGGSGDDTVSGAAGTDAIDAGDGNDKAYGDDGNDTLTG